jgi:peroxiredoxin family protein
MSTPAKVSVMVVSGSHERLQMAAMVASVAAVSGNQVTVFVSMNALAHFRRSADAMPSPEGEFGREMSQKKIPKFKELFAQAVELGDAKIFPCSFAMDVLALQPGDLEPYLAEPIGLTAFLIDAAGSQAWTF